MEVYIVLVVGLICGFVWGSIWTWRQEDRRHREDMKAR